MPGRWLGLLDDSEAALLRDKNLMYPNLVRPAPRKLWSRTNTILSPLTAEFQNPGLLGIKGHPLLLHNPDSLLIHYQDRQLTRVAGSAGNALWTTHLPFTIIQSVLPGDSSLILLSRIAIRYGLTDWQTLYNHPENAALKSKRPNPNVLFPGDEIRIPDLRKKKEQLPTAPRRHIIIRTPRAVRLQPQWREIAHNRHRRPRAVRPAPLQSPG